MKSKAVWISCIVAALFSGRTANAEVTMTLEQVGPNVVGTASGTVDLTDLSFDSNAGVALNTAYVLAMSGSLAMGPAVVPSNLPFSTASGFLGPTSIGDGFFIFADQGSGDLVSIQAGNNVISLPQFYVSGTPLFATATWDNSSVSGLGVTPGIYTWTWGSGDDADSLTLFAGVPVSTPEPNTWSLIAISLAALGGIVYQRRKSVRVPDIAGDAQRATSASWRA